MAVHPNTLANLKRTAGPGRPKGSRNKYSEKFIQDFYDDWKEHGKEAIAIVRDTATNDYLRIAASLISKEVKVTVEPYEDLTDEQLIARARELGQFLSVFGVGESPVSVKATKGQKPTSKLPPVH